MTNPLKIATDRANANRAAKQLADANSDKVDRQIATRFSEIRKLREKLPANLGNSLFKIVYLPVVGLFPNRVFTDTKVLNSAGFKTYHFPGSDLKDYPILADQAILLIDFEKFNQMYADKKRDDAQDELADHKDALLEWKKADAKWQERVEESDQAIAEWHELREKYLARKEKYDAYLTANENYAAALQKYTDQMKEFKAGKIAKLPKRPIKPLLVKPPQKIGPMPKEFDIEEHPRPKRPKPVSRNFSLDVDDMADIVVELTRDLRDLVNVDYVLMSSIHRKSPKNANIICFWLTENWKHKKLEKMAKVSVENWNFAFV